MDQSSPYLVDMYGSDRSCNAVFQSTISCSNLEIFAMKSQNGVVKNYVFRPQNFWREARHPEIHPAGGSGLGSAIITLADPGAAPCRPPNGLGYTLWPQNKAIRGPIFLPRDASAERGDATVSCPSVRLSVTFRYRVQIGWNSSKIISRPNSLRPLLWQTPNMGDLVQREHPQN